MSIKNTEPKIVYKGIHFTDVIASNIEKEGRILEIEYKETEDDLTVIITTDYAEGLTITKEELIYKNKLLDSWIVSYPYQQKKYLLFSRDEYNQLYNEFQLNLQKTNIA